MRVKTDKQGRQASRQWELRENKVIKVSKVLKESPEKTAQIMILHYLMRL